jgi:hypothetical protein
MLQALRRGGFVSLLPEAIQPTWRDPAVLLAGFPGGIYFAGLSRAGEWGKCAALIELPHIRHVGLWSGTAIRTWRSRNGEHITASTLCHSDTPKHRDTIVTSWPPNSAPDGKRCTGRNREIPALVLVIGESCSTQSKPAIWP